MTTLNNAVYNLTKSIDSFSSACSNIESYLNNPDKLIGIIIGITVVTSTMTTLLTSVMTTYVLKRRGF